MIFALPLVDRIELRGGGSLFGEFLSFKGTTSDLQALGAAKRSKVKQYEALHTWNFWSLFGMDAYSFPFLSKFIAMMLYAMPKLNLLIIIIRKHIVPLIAAVGKIKNSS